MITEFILDALKELFLLILSPLPVLDITMNWQSEFLDWFTDIVSTVSYFLPMADLLLMFGLWFAITNFEILWKIITRIWDALPFT